MLKVNVSINKYGMRALCALIIMVSLLSVYAEQIATTADGKKVRLKDNGTWEYIKDSKTTGSATQSSTVMTQKSGSTTETSGTGDGKKQHISSQEIESLVNIIQGDRASDFRNVSWGMSLEQVKKLENLKFLSAGKDSLKYDYKLIGMNCKVIYKFRDNKLVSARYNIEQKHIDPSLFNEDYVSLKQYFSKVIGTPLTDQDVWKNNLYKPDKTKWGFAVSIGFLTRMIIWKQLGTKILLQMNGHNHKIYITIKYSSLKLGLG